MVRMGSVRRRYDQGPTKHTNRYERRGHDVLYEVREQGWSAARELRLGTHGSGFPFWFCNLSEGVSVTSDGRPGSDQRNAMGDSGAGGEWYPLTREQTTSNTSATEPTQNRANAPKRPYTFCEALHWISRARKRHARDS